MDKQKKDMTTERIVAHILECEKDAYTEEEIQKIKLRISSLEIVLVMLKEEPDLIKQIFGKEQNIKEQIQICEDLIACNKRILELDDKRRSLIEFVKRFF